MKKHLKSTILCGVLVSALALTGCSESGKNGHAGDSNTPSSITSNTNIDTPGSNSDASVGASKGFASFDELAAANKAIMSEVKSFKLAGSVKFNIDVDQSSEGVDVHVGVPIALTYTIKAADTGLMHGDLRFTADFPEEANQPDMDESVTFYAAVTDTLTESWYTFGSDDTWYYSSSDKADYSESSSGGLDLSGFDFDKYKNMNFDIAGDFNKTADGYAVTYSLQSVFNTEGTKTIFGDLDTMLSEMSGGATIDDMLSPAIGMTLNDILTQLGKGKIVAIYDADGRITGINADDIKLEFSMTSSTVDSSEGVPAMTIGFKLSSANALSDYNTITDKDVTVPDDVKENAVPFGDFPTIDGDVDTPDFDYGGVGLPMNGTY